MKYRVEWLSPIGIRVKAFTEKFSHAVELARTLRENEYREIIVDIWECSARTKMQWTKMDWEAQARWRGL